jgi:hypothetical protein
MEAFVIDAQGLVVNKIIVDSLGQFPGMLLVDASGGGDIGWRFVDGHLVAPTAPEAQ